jgi:cytochrome o ubiquinol oxidase operon protein cyoD
MDSRPYRSLEESHGSFGSYTAGFVLSVLLTAAAFGSS